MHGVTIPNNSLVDFDDLLYRISTYEIGGQEDDYRYPTNANPELHDRALLCVTDLEDCCDDPRTVRGDWYYPNGNVVRSPPPGYGHRAFMTNRGPNEIRNGSHFYGSVRLWRRYSPPERGCFYCKLPSVANPNVTQILYINIGKFSYKQSNR